MKRRKRSSVTSVACPLCKSSNTQYAFVREARNYLSCRHCTGLFLHPDQRLPTSLEKARYDTHQNSYSDAGYRSHLNRLVVHMADKLEEGHLGLDYGAGPGPALPILFRQLNFNMLFFDPYYAPLWHVLNYSYNFITCTETAEHFYDPLKEFCLFDSLMHPGAWLGVMTVKPPEGDNLKSWYYLNDPTHVFFYSDACMHFIAARFHWQIMQPAKDITLFKKLKKLPKSRSSILNI